MLHVFSDMAKHRSPTAALLQDAPIAQLVEQLICNQWVGSSSLSGGTTFLSNLVEISHLFSGVLFVTQGLATK